MSVPTMSALDPAPIHAKGKPKCRWTAEEDQLLLKSISEFGTHNWKIIATKVPGRTSKQCRERWVGKLSPDVISSEWSEQEDELLKTLHEELGNQWAKISKHLNGRSMIAVKNRWCCLKRKFNHEAGSSPKPLQHEEKPIPAQQLEKKDDCNVCDSIFDFSAETWKDLDLLLSAQQYVFDLSEPF